MQIHVTDTKGGKIGMSKLWFIIIIIIINNNITINLGPLNQRTIWKLIHSTVHPSPLPSRISWAFDHLTPLEFPIPFVVGV